MTLSEEEMDYLRELVKISRQYPHVVVWVDRDGSDRQTVLAPAAMSRLKAIAQREKTSVSELLIQAAYVPVDKKNRAPVKKTA